jgi:hypothetical protein
MSTHSPQELLAKFDLHPPSTAPGRYHVPCPKCSAKRSTKEHQRARYLGITIDDKAHRWGCSHCGWTGPSKSNSWVERARAVPVEREIDRRGIRLKGQHLAHRPMSGWAAATVVSVSIAEVFYQIIGFGRTPTPRSRIPHSSARELNGEGD